MKKKPADPTAPRPRASSCASAAVSAALTACRSTSVRARSAATLAYAGGASPSLSGAAAFDTATAAAAAYVSHTSRVSNPLWVQSRGWCGSNGAARAILRAEDTTLGAGNGVAQSLQGAA